MLALILHIYSFSFAWLPPLVSSLASPFVVASAAVLVVSSALVRWPATVGGGWVCSCGRLRPPGQTCAGCGRA